jgi:hypothetical protein
MCVGEPDVCSLPTLFGLKPDSPPSRHEETASVITNPEMATRAVIALTFIVTGAGRCQLVSQ